MAYIRSHILSRIFCIFMALHVFNVSIDAPDVQPYDVPEDLSINDQETIVELVLEQGLGIDNAVEEHDEPGDESNDFELNKEFKIYPNHSPSIEFRLVSIKVKAVSYHESLYWQYSLEINPPPPKA